MGPVRWLAPFRFGGRIHGPLLAAFLAINGLVAANALIHDSAVGYDADAHIDYVTAMAQGALPSREQSVEFYAPPLPYAVPALLGLAGITDGKVLGKAAQAANVVYGLVLTYFLIRICRRLRPSDPRFATWGLLLLGMLTAFYRTMAFVRGEALCAALAVVLADRLLADQNDDRAVNDVWLGVLAGLLLLAKEWGVFIVFAMLAFMALRRRRALAPTLLIATLIGGWFYPYLLVRFGSPATYSERDTPWSLNHRPAEFFTATGSEYLFTAPYREHFSEATQLLLPIAYSDIWGDYWCYWLTDCQEVEPQLFSPAARYLDGARPPSPIGPYMARLNIAGVLPSVVFAGGAVLGLLAVVALLRRRASAMREGFALCALAAFAQVAGFVVLLMWVPTVDVKASYLLPAFPFAAVLAAGFLATLRTRMPQAATAVEGLLAIVIAHNLPAFLSRFSLLS